MQERVYMPPGNDLYIPHNICLKKDRTFIRPFLIPYSSHPHPLVPGNGGKFLGSGLGIGGGGGMTGPSQFFLAHPLC